MLICVLVWRRKTRVIDGGVWALRRFLWYCLYSWGCPLVIALATVVIEKLPDSYDVIRPNFSNHACWFYGKTEKPVLGKCGVHKCGNVFTNTSVCIAAACP